MPLDRKHRRILKVNGFESCGTLAKAMKSDAWDGDRVIYAITDPAGERIVYVGDTERGRDLRGRLKSHLNDRSKMGLVEPASRLWVHFMVTEYKVLCDFEDSMGAMPELNRRKVPK